MPCASRTRQRRLLGLTAWAVVMLPATALHAQVAGAPVDASTDQPDRTTATATATAAPAPAEPGPRYILAMAMLHAPVFPGAASSANKVRPAFSFQLGRWTVSTSRAVDLGGLQVHQTGPGASTVLRETEQWQTGLSFRVHSGRNSADDPALAGLPDIPASLEARLSASLRLAAGWSASTAWTQDLGHPRHGARISTTLGWSGTVAEGWRARAGLGLEAANGNFMRTHFGVPSAAALPGSRPAYTPGAGWISASLGGSLQYRVSPHWIVTTSATYGRLAGPAASSPLTQRAGAFSTLVGLAYVNKGN